MLEAVPWENPTYGISGGAAGNLAYGGTVNPPRNRKGGLETLRLRVRAPVPYPTRARRGLLPGEGSTASATWRWLDKGWLGGGNTARNTMTIRSNYIRPPSVPFHEGSMALYRELSRELNYNLMVGRRGMISFLQSSAAARTAARMANTMHVYGAKYELIDVEEIKRRLPIFRPPPRPRLEVLGGVCQPDAMMARHDAVAWGFARMADAHGVDIIQNCEVTGIRRDGGRVTGVETARGVIEAGKVGMAVAGHGAVVAAMAGLRLPIEVQPLQAWVSEPVKPVLDEILVFSGYGCYMMQSDKGELVIGGPTDPYPSYAQRGTFRTIEQVTSAVLEMFPIFARMKLLRHWAGMLDIVYDGSPVISKTPLRNFYVDVAGAGGFKTTPMAARMHAWLIAKDEPHELNQGFRPRPLRARTPRGRGRSVVQPMTAGPMTVGLMTAGVLMEADR